jgi:hypothetical protein
MPWPRNAGLAVARQIVRAPQASPTFSADRFGTTFLPFIRLSNAASEKKTKWAALVATISNATITIFSPEKYGAYCSLSNARYGLQ